MTSARATAVLSARLVASAARAQSSPLNRPGDIAHRFAARWHPPHEGDEIASRLSVRRDGSLSGKPRIAYVKAVGGTDGEAALANSITAAIQARGPLRFTTALGGARACPGNVE